MITNLIISYLEEMEDRIAIARKMAVIESSKLELEIVKPTLAD